MSNSKRIFTIDNINESQFSVLINALELYSRLGMLQLDRAVTDEVIYGDTFKVYEVRDKIDYHFNEIKKLILSTATDNNLKTLSSSHNLTGWSLGIGSESTPMGSKIAYEVYNTLRLNEYITRNKNKPKGIFYNPPTNGLKFTNNPNVEIKVESERVRKIKKILED